MDTGPPNIAQARQIFGHSSSATGWINWFYSKFRLAVVASQMMRGQAPQIFFPRTATGRVINILQGIVRLYVLLLACCLLGSIFVNQYFTR